MSRNLEAKSENPEQLFNQYAEGIFKKRPEADRTERTAELIEELIPGANAVEFINKACEEAKKKDPSLNIISPKEGGSLAMATLMLQYKVFRMVKDDNPNGCDGLFGFNTLTECKAKIPAMIDYINEIKRHELITEKKAKRRELGSAVASNSDSQNNSVDYSDKRALAQKGITPFKVSMGYRLSPEEMSIYKGLQLESNNLSTMSLEQRQRVLQERYQLMESYELAFNALNIKKEHWPLFLAYNDAVMKIESGYNPIGVNKQGNKIILSTASGAYQILNSVWKEGTHKWLGNNKSFPDLYNRKVRPEYRIDFNKFKNVGFNEDLPGQATPYKHAIFHNLYAFKGSRFYRGAMAYDEVFDRILQHRDPPEIRDTYMMYLYANWRNGFNGASFILRNLRKNPPVAFPQNEKQAQNYFENNLELNDWQKTRGPSDFYAFVRACKIFMKRFKENLREQGIN